MAAKLIDRLNQEIEVFSKRAQQALDEGKLKLELLRLKRQRNNAARDLGFLFHRRERGAEIEARQLETLMSRIDDLDADVTKLERQIASVRGESVSVL